MICMGMGTVPVELWASTAQDQIQPTAAIAGQTEGDETTAPLTSSTGGGLYLTEIYPNDIDRNAVYGNASDHMEYVELTNTLSTAISFNSDYGLYYEYPSGANYILKKLAVAKTDGSTDITLAAGETVVVWSKRTDLASHASEAEFRANWFIPNSVQVLTMSGQNGFAEDNRGFAIKKTSTNEVVSHFRYTTAVDTADGLAVHLAIPAEGSEMIAFEQLTYGSPGVAYSDQLGRDIKVPEDLTPEGLYITEIRANDVDRSSTYGTSNDYMECLELYNSSDNSIDFNKDYELAYLYKASAYAQPVTTVTDAAIGLAIEPVIIPPHSAAVIWCYRQELKGSSISFPTEENFRDAYGIPEEVPVYAQTGQNGWGNEDRGFALLKKNVDGSRTNVSYYFWNGKTDLKDNRSVDLKISADGPKMSIYKALSVSNMSVVAPEQYTFFPDDGTSPQLQLLDTTGTLQEGQFFRVPYSYAGSSALPVTSIDLFYKTSAMDAYSSVSTSAFPIFYKFYPFIDNAELLGVDYVDYYLKANNAYRTTTTEVRRITMLRNDNYESLRVNFNSSEAANGAVLSGTADISAKDFNDTAAGITFTLDGQAVTAWDSLERFAYFTFDYNGVDGYFKNGLTTKDQVISVFAKCSEVPGTDSLAIPVSQSLFTYKEDGSATIELTLRAGTYGSTWEANTPANNDDFTAGNFKLKLTDGTLLGPTTTVNMNNAAVDPAVMNKMGDSANCTVSIAMTFDIPAEKIDAQAFTLDTTELSDGSHTLTATSGTNEKTVDFTVDNSLPQKPEEQTVDVNVSMSVDNADTSTASVATGDKVETVTVYKATDLEVVTVKEGKGDSTAAASEKTDTAATVSNNGDYPYQLLEIPVTDDSVEALRITVDAEVNYSQPIQLYVLNTVTDSWDLIDNTTEKDGVITGVCDLSEHVTDGVAKVLIQARGTEYAPYTKTDTFVTEKNNYDWDGTAVPEQYDFSIAWISDTQYYAEQYMENFESVTDWIVDSAEDLDIKYVVHTGDIVDEFNEEYQFVNAGGQLKKFEDAGIPYGVLAGNHDVAHGNMRYDLYWKYFGEDRYKDNPVYGSSYNNNLGHYDLVTVDGEELLFIYMSWDVYYPETDWINSVLAQYSDRKAIIAIHGGINAVGTQSYVSDFLLENVCKENKNVMAIINGHYHGSSLNFKGFDDDGDGISDRVVYQLCTDYQSAPGGGSGYLKMLYFDLANDKIYLNSYSPVLDDFNYYDTPKLDSYGIGTLAYDIDITELSADFSNKAEKALTVSSVSVSGLTDTVLGTSDYTGSSTDVALSGNNGETVTAYGVLRDAQENILGYTNTVSFTMNNPVGPALTAGEVSRLSHSEATVNFTSDKEGAYFYAITEDGAGTPEIDTTGNGTTFVTTEQTIQLNHLTPGAKNIYIVAKDTHGRESNVLIIAIPAYAGSGETGPTLTAGEVKRISQSEATVKFTSDKEGWYYYALTEKGSPQPEMDTSGDGATCGTTEQAFTLTNLTTADMLVYIVVKDTDGNVSSPLAIAIPAYGESDSTPPTLTAGDVNRLSHSEASVRFTSDEAGTYYYTVVEYGDPAPEIDTTGSGTTCGTTEQAFTLTNLTPGAKALYLVAKDTAGNVSSPLIVAIPAYSAPSGGETDDDDSDTPTLPPVKVTTQNETTIVGITLSGYTDTTGKYRAFMDLRTAAALLESAKAAEKDGKKAIVEVKLAPGTSSDSAEITIPKSSFNSLAVDTDAALTVDTVMGTITFDASAIEAINTSAASGDIRISIAKAAITNLSGEAKEKVGDRPVYDFTVSSGSSTISDFGGGSARISLPYTLAIGEDPNAIVVFHIGESGMPEIVRGKFNGATGMVEMTTNGFSTYAVGYNKVNFNDVAATDWYHDAVTFVAAREITGGTGNGNYSPNGTLTRGQFIVMLMRAYGIQAEENPADNFSDAGSTYYTKYLAAAKHLGITSGTGNNRFSPDSAITRQDMFTLLYRALNSLEELPQASVEKTVSDFSDAGSIAEHARSAMNTLVQGGIIAGSEGKLNPLDNMTRGELAQILFSLLSK